MRDVRDAFAQIAGDRRAFTGASAHHELGGRVVALVVITFALDVFGTVMMMWVGNHSFRESAVWTSSSLLTGGAALDPVGQRHYWVGLGLEMWAITAVGVLAGSFGAFFHRLYLERDNRGTSRAERATRALPTTRTPPQEARDQRLPWNAEFEPAHAV